MKPLLVLLAASCILTPLAAQRGRPTFKWKGGSIAMDHGSPRFGKHTLSELPPGGTWRLGNNEATTFTTDVPLVAGEQVVAPGEYRAKIHRGGDGKQFELQLDYGGWALAADDQDVVLPGTLSEDKPAAKLEIELVGDKSAVGPKTGPGSEKAPAGELGELDRRVTLAVRFGPHRLGVPFTAVGGVPGPKVPGYRLTVYPLPASLVERRLSAGKATVVATLRPSRRVSGRKAPPFHNLVLTKDAVKLVPALRAPQESYGFANLDPWDKKFTTSAEPSWTDVETEAPRFAVQGVKASRNGVSFTFAAGKRLGTVEIALPARAPK